MRNIKIVVANKIAINMTPGVPIVCGNSGYTVTFDFDEEWTEETSRVARFVYYVGRRSYFKDLSFTGDTVDVPVLSNIDYVLVGVYAGDLSTTTPARVPCKRSILCGDSVEQITPEEKASLQAQIGDLAQLQTKDKDNLVKAINELFGNGGATAEQIAQAVEAYLAEHPAGGVAFTTDKTLTLSEDGVLSVNTADAAEQDNTLPITSAAVHTTVGNIELLLKTI